MPMADPGFPRGKGDTNSQRGCTKLLFLQIICRELHENERVWTEREAHVPMDAAAFGGYLFLGLFLSGQEVHYWPLRVPPYLIIQGTDYQLR